MKKNIVLIGFMGSGKTVVSRKIAAMTGYRAVDTDDMVEKKSRMKIKDIFAKYGERRFRDLESRAAKKASSLRGAVIATGGGIIKRPENMEALAKTGFIVYLKNSFRTTYGRVKDDTNRPLFTRDNIVAFRKLFNKRVPVYKRYADFTVATDRLGVEQVARRIIKKAGMKIG
ncbi:MAG TPA: shikimate kinase [Candidatus Goldiibacteriota bacterium]|nr:shikimate kinase [Candidatus Goldiibacteriota bacterium]